MYCVKCGVQLADTEKKCPLCLTPVYCPQPEQAEPLYPAGRVPADPGPSKRLNGAAIIIFLIPLLVSLVCDLHPDGQPDWFGYVAGALLVGYVAFALPLWFRRPNPVIFVPCAFAAATAYLLYIDLATHGGWFLSFALPVTGASCVIASAATTLLWYLRRGRLYVVGGLFLALGGLLVLVESLLCLTFCRSFVGWSVYSAVGLGSLGALLLYLAISAPAREVAQRKLFF